MPKRIQRKEELEVQCRCGNLQMTAAFVAFKCKLCKGFNYVDSALERAGHHTKFLEGKQGKLGGYCADCGMMKIKSERPCPRCGGTGITRDAPRPAGNIVAVSLLGHRPQVVGNMFQ